MATKKTVAAILFRFSEIFPGRQITESGIDVYADLFCDIDDQTLKIAARDCLLQCRFFPTIAEIRERIPENLRTLEVQTSDQLWRLGRGVALDANLESIAGVAPQIAGKSE